MNCPYWESQQVIKRFNTSPLSGSVPDGLEGICGDNDANPIVSMIGFCHAVVDVDFVGSKTTA
jgi:hypothetical protein